MYLLLPSRMPAVFGIDSRCWIFDGNQRQYVAGQAAPIFRGHFCEGRCVGENQMSWLIKVNGASYKIDKRTGDLRQPDSSGWFAIQRTVLYSEQQVDEACYVHDNMASIVEHVRQCRDGQVLKQIARLLEI